MCKEFLEYVALLRWPIVVLVSLVLIIFNYRRIARIFEPILGRLKSINAFGASFDFTEEGARELSFSFYESFSEYISQADSAYKRSAESKRLSDGVRSLITKELSRVIKNNYPNVTSRAAVRATIFVPDIVFSGMLYQVINYQTMGGFEVTRGVGRRFSVRYGIIGRAWRLEESVGEASAFMSNGKHEKKVRKLIHDWGMTREEAEGHKTRALPSYLVVVLREILDMGAASDPSNQIEYGARPAVGLLFIDCKQAYRFGSDATKATELAKKLEEHPAVKELSKKVTEILDRLSRQGTRIEIES